jgi:hypothetical protein
MEWLGHRGGVLLHAVCVHWASQRRASDEARSDARASSGFCSKLRAFHHGVI